jgi:hypothetical protein
MATIRRRWHEESMRSVDESLELVRDGRSPHVRARLEWETLTPDEIEHISELFGQIEEICHRARSRGSLVPDDARPVHVALQLCELGTPVMPTPLLIPEVNRRSGALGDLVDRIDSARNRQRTATA